MAAEPNPSKVREDSDARERRASREARAEAPGALGDVRPHHCRKEHQP
ncbi:hypothetical protein [Streptomyces sp. NPDC059009]